VNTAEESYRMTEPVSDLAPAPARRLPAFVIVLGIGILFVAALLALLLTRPPQKSLCAEAAPDWSLTLFPEYRGGVAGDTLTLADLKGKGVVLNFWASWCKPCEEEAAALEAAWRQYKDKGIVFVGVDYLDQDPSAKRYLQKFNVTYPNGPDLASKISKRYAIRGVPETFFIDPQGKIVGCRWVGPLGDAELRRRIAEIMPK
jgi:cytochrome c biogenesis protein CcmG/thiol:disulfide interchange protein DsbE